MTISRATIKRLATYYGCQEEIDADSPPGKPPRRGIVFWDGDLEHFARAVEAHALDRAARIVASEDAFTDLDVIRARILALKAAA